MTFLKAVLLASSLALAAPVTQAATIVNGSLEGEVKNGVATPPAVPLGWSVRRQTPDTSDVNGNAGGFGTFAVAPAGPSPDGGTWASIGAEQALSINGVPFNESLQTQVTGLEIGKTYRVSWYVGNFGVVFDLGTDTLTYNAPGALRALVNEVEIGTGQLRQVGSAWYSEFAEFTASSATSFLAFETVGSDLGQSYLALDGVTITLADSAVVPLPASLPMLLAAFGLLPLACRRVGRG